ncbi:hypothetical protein [Pelagibacterium mangrovi]|uniref:hypothetical protein n=1 Tax=Pelagibacterium mangrovi TaxID=3119828 RepID=UPI002FCAA424
MTEFVGRKFAGPGTQIAYEKSLGRFLVAFNRAENYVRETVKLSLKSLGREDFWNELKSSGLLHQARNLELLALAQKDFPETDYAFIKDLNIIRNTLAHGHFDQDLFSEEYKIVGKDRDRKHTIEEIDAWTMRTEDFSRDLELMIMDYFFDAHFDPELEGES